MRKSGRKERDARLAWLRGCPDLWCDLPSLDEDISPENRNGLRFVAVAMTDAGLFSRNTRPDQVVWGLRGLIGELRGRPVVNPWRSV